MPDELIDHLNTVTDIADEDIKQLAEWCNEPVITAFVYSQVKGELPPEDES